jgi:hypothetical protein
VIAQGVMSDDGAAVRPPLDQWTSADVMEWLDCHGLSHTRNSFAGYDGKAIIALKKMKMEAPEFFYVTMKDDMGFKRMLDLTRFTNALEDIED